MYPNTDTPYRCDTEPNTPERAKAVLALFANCDTLDLLPENFLTGEDLANVVRVYCADALATLHAEGF